MPVRKYVVTTTDPDTGERTQIPLTPERQRLVADNLGTAVWAVTERFASIARQLGDRDEAISVAYEAMVEAARRYDFAGEVKYVTYATSYIRAYLLTAVGLCPMLSRRSHTGTGYESMPMLSLDMPVRADGRQVSHGDIIPDHRDQAEGMSPDEADAVAHALRHLDERTRYVVRRLVCDGEVARVVGREVGVSGEAVRQIRERGLAKLRRAMGVGVAEKVQARRGKRPRRRRKAS